MRSALSWIGLANFEQSDMNVVFLFKHIRYRLAVPGDAPLVRVIDCCRRPDEGNLAGN
jgi:hypothetical protein